MSVANVRQFFIFLILIANCTSHPAWAKGFFGYSAQAKKFMALCNNEIPQSSDSKKIIAELMHNVGDTRCETAWESLKGVDVFDFHGLDLRDISTLSVIKHAKKIDLRHNLISDLSPLNGIENLEILLLDDNCLRSVGSLTSTGKLSSISLTDNRLGLLEIQYFITTFGYHLSYATNIQNPQKARCSAPSSLPTITQNPPREPVLNRSTSLTRLPPLPTPRVAWGGGRRLDSGSTSSQAPMQHIPPLGTSIQKLSPDALNTLVSEQLKKIKRHGVAFTSVISLEEVNDFPQLKTALEEVGLTNLPDDDYLRYLYQIGSLLDEIAEENPTAREPQRRMSASHQLNFRWLQQKSQGRSYSQRLAELKTKRVYDDDFFIKFYTMLTKNQNLLASTPYPAEENFSLAHKYNDLVLILAAVKQEGTGSSEHRILSRSVFAQSAETYDSSGQRLEWYEELRYKLFKLYQTYPLLPQDKKQALLTYLLHGGHYCNDAKWHAVTDAFNRFCPDEAEAIDNEYGAGSGGHNLQAMLTKTITKLKISELTGYINSHIDHSSKNREYCSYFNATWDTLAPNLGLYSVGSKYRMVIPAAVNGYSAFLQEKFTAATIIKAVQDDAKSFLKKYYFGPLMQLTSDGDEVIVSMLHYFSILY
jgi:hypothetical protein